MEYTTTEQTEEFKISGYEVLKKVRELIQGGNARRIIIRNEKKKSLVEIPLTLGIVGIFVVPVLTVAGTIAALLTNCTIVVVRNSA